MNTRILKLMTAIVAVLFIAVTANGQQKTMYVMKKGVVDYKSAVSEIDSIIFYEPKSDGVLINGVVWAKYNVDAPGTFAATPEAFGMFYQWNRETAYPATGNATNWNSTIPEGKAWEEANDPSPDGWRVPTLTEIRTLLDTDKVESEWITQNDVVGRIFTDKTTGNSIFLPAGGYRNASYSGGPIHSAAYAGDYWSSVQNLSYDAYHLYFNSDVLQTRTTHRHHGHFIRPVAE